MARALATLAPAKMTLQKAKLQQAVARVTLCLENPLISAPFPEETIAANTTMTREEFIACVEHEQAIARSKCEQELVRLDTELAKDEGDDEGDVGTFNARAVLAPLRILSTPTTTIDKNAFIRAATAGHVDVVLRMLEDPLIDPSADYDAAIRYASINGHVGVVTVLMADSDPSAKDNAAICTASRNGHVEVVKVLLTDARVDPSADNNAAIRGASHNGHTDVVKLLLADDRVDPSALDNEAIRGASAYGCSDVVDVLLADDRVDPSAINNQAIRGASRNGHVDVVTLLLADDRVDPSAHYNDAIRSASYNGRLAVVKVLLADARVDPSVDNNYAERMARLLGYTKLADLLRSCSVECPVAVCPVAVL